MRKGIYFCTLVSALILSAISADAAQYRLGVIGSPSWNGGLEIHRITNYNGIAAECMIGPGDVVLSIGGRAVNSPAQVRRILDDMGFNMMNDFYVTYRSSRSPRIQECFVSRMPGGGAVCAPPMN